MWTAPGWFIHQLDVQICFWSSAAWPQVLVLEVFHFVFWFFLNKLNKHPASPFKKAPITYKLPLKSVWNKNAGGILEDLQLVFNK